MAIETPYSHIVALVIDDMAVQQTTLRGQLAMLGITKVEQTATAEDAIRLVRTKPYGLILCDYNLNRKTDGQQFFEYLRDNNLLSPDCLFFMVTAESNYSSVASATEHKPDAYLLKPITAGDISERLKGLLERKKALLAINLCLNKKDLPGALEECEKLIVKKDRWLMSALQVKGQALLDLGRHEDARLVYVHALDLRPNLGWAQIGMAKAHKAGNNFEEAKQIAYDIINTKGSEMNMEAYDVIAQSLEAQGDAKGALWVLKDSALVVPSVRRQRVLAESAYRNGDLDLAKESYLKVAKGTKGSMTSLPQDSLALSQTLVDRGEGQEALAALDEGVAGNRNNPQFENVALAIRAQAHVKNGDIEAAKKVVAKARETMRQPRADFATVALAKAELMTGNEEAGIKLLSAAVSSDHENPRVKQLISNTLRDTGHEDKIHAVVEAMAAGLNARVSDAKALFRNSKIDEALAAIEAALKDYPENTGVLLQAAQMNCLTLRLKKQLNVTVVERVRMYLSRLDKLMPANDRVAQMHRYYRETLAALSAQAKS